MSAKCMRFAIASFAILLFSMVIVNKALCCDKVIVSLPRNKLLLIGDSDRISKIRIGINGGWVFGITNIPREWIINITNEDVNLRYHYIVEGLASHGVAFLPKQALVDGAFDRFLVIEKNCLTDPEGKYFDINMDITIDSILREHEVTISFKMDDLLIVPYIPCNDTERAGAKPRASQKGQNGLDFLTGFWTRQN